MTEEEVRRRCCSHYRQSSRDRKTPSRSQSSKREKDPRHVRSSSHYRESDRGERSRPQTATRIKPTGSSTSTHSSQQPAYYAPPGHSNTVAYVVPVYTSPQYSSTSSGYAVQPPGTTNLAHYSPEIYGAPSAAMPLLGPSTVYPAPFEEYHRPLDGNQYTPSVHTRGTHRTHGTTSTGEVVWGGREPGTGYKGDLESIPSSVAGKGGISVHTHATHRTNATTSTGKIVMAGKGKGKQPDTNHRAESKSRNTKSSVTGRSGASIPDSMDRQSVGGAYAFSQTQSSAQSSKGGVKLRKPGKQRSQRSQKS
jgi:hypothetical protein